MVHGVEYQKRELPYAHILLISKQENMFCTVENHDCIVCAELLNENLDPKLHK